ncbi:DEAD/DEAH box helicase [Gordonia aichiensis]|uniref:DEAD/DEAH box helicase n=1 Tax=Gordonia aichiensis TaxID=36820 RepID=UPI0032675FF1
MTEALTSALMDVLEDRGSMSSSDLAIEVRTSADTVERVLSAHARLFEPVDGMVSRWALKSAESFSDALGLRRVLHTWQVRALQRWLSQGRTGMVSAVTGAGKTEVGLAAIADARVRGLPSLIVVPSEEMVGHWSAAVTGAFPGVAFGMVTATHSLRSDAGLVIMHSACVRSGHSLIGPRGLVIVDEVQRLSATDVSGLTAAVGAFKERLGLTSSIHWSDNPRLPPIPPMFGAEIIGCTYEMAIDERVLSPVAVVTAGVGFTKHEREEYAVANQRVGAAEAKLRDSGADLSHGVYPTACQLASDVESGQASVYAKEYVRAERRRRQVLAGCQAKISALEQLYSGLESGSRAQALVFTNDDGSAQEAQRAAASAGLKAASILVNHPARDAVERFRAFDLDILSTSQLTLEDVDVPAAGLGIVVSPAQDDDEMRHRLGRIVGPAGSLRPGMIIYLYVNGTVEDPVVSESAGITALKVVASTFVDVDIDDAVGRIREWSREDAELSAIEAVGDKGVMLAASDDWSIRDAILDVVDEYEGVPLWNELREVLPDMEAEEALRGGMPQLNWMRIGGQLVGAGGRETTRSERIEALSALARAVDRFGDREVLVFDLSSQLESATLLGDLQFPRMKAIWTQLGGRLSAAASPTHRSISKPVASSGGQRGIDPIEADEDDPLTAAVRVAVAARGGKMRRNGAAFAVTGRDGVQRTVSVAGVRGHTKGHPNGVRVLVDVTKASPSFFLFNTSRDGRDQPVESISTTQWTSAEGAWHKLRLGAAAKAPSLDDRRSTETEQSQPVRPSQLPASPKAASQLSAAAGSEPSAPGRVNVNCADGGVKVTLNEVDISATFDPATGQITLGDIPGHRKLSGRKFRNAAVAAATVKSRLAGHTVFSAGSSDWSVVGERSIRLDTYRDQEAG